MAWISEIHYQNGYASSSSVAEFVEISLSPDEFARAGDFEFAAYQGTGTSSPVYNLGTLTPVIDPDNGYYVYTIQILTTAPDTVVLGTADYEAVALIDTSLASPVVEFYDIGGGTQNITAVDGPAAGATSTNIPAAAGGSSIQFDAYGNRIDGAVTPGSTVICFCKNTAIATGDGNALVEDLNVGDLVETFNGDLQPLRWIGRRKFGAADLARNPKLLPVRICAGALGGGLPLRDLLVSRQHRMLVSSKIAERMFGQKDVLVSAIKLTALPGIYVDESVTEVEYFHLLFEHHEVLYAEGAPSESLYPGPEALKAVTSEARAEILEIFPVLARRGFFAEPAAPIPEGYLQKSLITRHAKNHAAILG